jgi:hypothetical protein
MSGEPATFSRFGIRFQYPANWQLHEDQVEAWPVSLSLQSPGTAFWSLTLYRKLLPVETVAEEALAALRAEYSDLDVAVSPLTTSQGEGRAYDLNFYCLDLLIAGRLQVFDYHDHTFVILSQAEDREFDRSQLVLRAITESLFR